MKAKTNNEELNLVSLAKKYSNENRARKLFEQLRWPGGKLTRTVISPGVKQLEISSP